LRDCRRDLRGKTGFLRRLNMSAPAKDFTSADIAGALIGAPDAETKIAIFKALGKTLTNPKLDLNITPLLISAVALAAATHADPHVRILGYQTLPLLAERAPTKVEDTVVMSVYAAGLTAKNADVKEAAAQSFKTITSFLALKGHAHQRNTPKQVVDALETFAPARPGAEAKIKKTVKALREYAAS